MKNRAQDNDFRKRSGAIKVDFMIIGAQKCGTTNLAAQLAAHPNICFCQIKEPGYFHQTTEWQAGLAEYHQLFAPEDGQICGEASTMYTFLPEWQDTHVRLAEYNPSLKLIYIMRQPVERIISHYAHESVRGYVNLPPEETVFDQASYINRSCYGMQIRPYLERFPRQQILLLTFEEYVANQQKTLDQITGFLEIPRQAIDDKEPTRRHSSVGTWYLKNDTVRKIVHTHGFQSVRNYIPASIRKPIRRHFSNRLQEKPYFSPALKQEIWRLIEDDISVVEDLLGRRLDIWRREYKK
jgi:hypothetical protein